MTDPAADEWNAGMKKRRWIPVVAIALMILAGLLVWRSDAFAGKRASAAASAGTDGALGGTDAGEDGNGKTRRPRPELAKPSLMRQALDGKEIQTQLTPAQVERFLELQGRTAESLLAASRLRSGEEGLAYLKEAATRFPQNAMVQLELSFVSRDPADRREAIDRFRELDPDNSLGNLLSASLGFKEGDPERAVEDLEQATGKPRYGSNLHVYYDQMETAYASAGFAPVDAKALAHFGCSAPEIMNVSNLSKDVEAARAAFLAEGNSDMADRLLRSALDASRQPQANSPTVLQELAGLALESRLLKLGNSTDPSVANLISELEGRKKMLVKQSSESLDLLRSIPDREILHYLGNVREKGEKGAIEDLEAIRR